MSFLYAAEYDELRERASRWVEEIVRPALAQVDQDTWLEGRTEDAFFRSIDAGGFTGKSPRHPDGGFDRLALWIILEELAKASASLALTWEHRMATAEILKPMMSPEQRQIFENYLRDGTLLVGAITEPDAGSNPAEIRALAERRGDKWVINAHKKWIGNANQVEALFLTCLTKEEGQPQGHAFFFVERKHGWTTRAIPMLGMDMHPVCEVIFENVEVPLAAKLNPIQNTAAATQGVFVNGRVNLAIIAVGVAQQAFDAALEYAKTREQFGRKIGGFQLIQAMLAEMATDITCGRLLAYRAADAAINGSSDQRLLTSMAKMFCTEMAMRVTSHGIQILGALGLAREAGMERLFRDARMLTVPDGPTQIQQLIIGRELTGLNAIRG